jgi:Fur family ferric uptake transcriptional regulator
MIIACNPGFNAKELVRATGERVTDARVRVLSLLLAAPRALTHQEVEQGLDAALRIDRVTVYRVLDWLTRHRLAHRISSGDRVWRFNAAPAEHDANHAHFQCVGCGSVICLQDLPAAIPRLPEGYIPETLEVTIKGRCDECTARNGAPTAPLSSAGEIARGRT